MWSWAHEDVDHRTELLEAFAHADAVTEEAKQTKKAKPNNKNKLWHVTISCRWPPYLPRIRFCCLHERFHVFFLLRFQVST